MLVAFFLLPKNDTVYLTEKQSLRQGLEKMQHHGYSTVPILNENGCYVGAISAADILLFIKNNYDLNLAEAEKILLGDIPRSRDNKPVSVNAEIKDLLDMAMTENFIPVIDDGGVYIGIVRRREIMEFYRQQYQKLTEIKED